MNRNVLYLFEVILCLQLANSPCIHYIVYVCNSFIPTESQLDNTHALTVHVLYDPLV